VDTLFDTDWVVYANPPFGGALAVLRYRGRYTHRVAISNHRLVAFDGDHVTFQWKDYAHHDQRRTMTLSAMSFSPLRAAHPPARFVRIRQSGFLANTCRAARVTARAHAPHRGAHPRSDTGHGDRSVQECHVACPRCGAAMIFGRSSPRCQLSTITFGWDTS